MAEDDRTKVYLGYEDEYVTEKHRSLVNFTTNKIGGKPVCMSYYFDMQVIDLFFRQIVLLCYQLIASNLYTMY